MSDNHRRLTLGRVLGNVLVLVLLGVAADYLWQRLGGSPFLPALTCATLVPAVGVARAVPLLLGAAGLMLWIVSRFRDWRALLMLPAAAVLAVLMPELLTVVWGHCV